MHTELDRGNAAFAASSAFWSRERCMHASPGAFRLSAIGRLLTEISHCMELVWPCVSRTSQRVQHNNCNALILNNPGGGVQAALNEKMADFTANAKQFTMDGGIVYEFKDEDDYKTAKKDLSHLKKAMASNWVEQPRQRKVRIGYNESEFLKASMKAAKEEKVKGPRLTKMPQLNDFQFFNTQRIEELYGIEHAHENWKFQQHHRRLELEKANMSPEEIEAELNKCVSPPCLLFQEGRG
jgi:hypothetical protein